MPVLAARPAASDDAQAPDSRSDTPAPVLDNLKNNIALSPMMTTLTAIGQGEGGGYVATARTQRADPAGGGYVTVAQWASSQEEEA